jgi:hypothetical protein
MTPKEKAIELVDKYYWTFGDGYLGEQHIQCALIAIDEVLQYSKAHGFIGLTEYYEEVKQEIEKL